MKEWTPVTTTECAAACFAGPCPTSARVLLSGAEPMAAMGSPLAAGSPRSNSGAGSALVVGVRRRTDTHIPEAARRALAAGARLLIVHAHGSLTAHGRVRVERDVAATASILRSAGVQASYELREGPPAAVLADVAREIGADLLLIGSGRPRRAGRRIGRTGRALGRHAPCPVVLVGRTDGTPAAD